MLAIAGRTAGPDWLTFLKKSIVTLGMMTEAKGSNCFLKFRISVFS